MAEIDEVIEAHGGWPDAFQTGAPDRAGEVALDGGSLAAERPD